MKEYKRFFMLMLFLSAGGIITGTYYDYNIAEYLFNEHNWISIFLECVVYYVLYITVPILCDLILLKSNRSYIKYIGYLINTFIFTAILVSSLLFLRKRDIYIINFKVSIIIAFFAAIILGYILFNILNHINLEVREKLQLICIFALGLILWRVTFTNGLKTLVGRARYCDIVHGIGYYTPWYSINRPSMGKSFPSGHVSDSCGIMIILFLPLMFQNLKKYKLKLEISVLVYILIAAFSRMILGKHMLSDVSTAMFIMTSGFMVMVRLFEKIKKN